MENTYPTLVVTGGTKGIGKAIAEKFAQKQFQIFTCSRKEANIKALIAEFAEKFPQVKLYAIAADLSQKAEVNKFAEFVLSHTVQIDVLVNNTGFFLPGQIHNEAEGTLEAMIETNLYSAYHLTRALLPTIIKRKQGHIFNICSTASITAYTNGGSYCISKFALYGFSKVLRAELKTHNIRVTAILPGATLTDSWAGVDLPPERFMKPEDVAEALWACYQLSPQSVVEEVLIRPQLGDIG
ncbi:MAG: SDR family oxidoreductase [Raineya sp.]|nr:SDR family oxidoreductase [Raineya sp.]